MADETRASLAQALLAVQKEIKPVPKHGTNPHFNSKFVTLDDLLREVLPVLNAHGLTLIQAPDFLDQSTPALTTTIVHESGEQVESTMPLVFEKQDMQKLGGAITYARRYMLTAMLGISEQTDDDGNLAARPPDRRQDPELPIPKSAAEVETAWLALGLEAVWLEQAREVKPKPTVQKMGTVLHRLYEQGPLGPIGNWETAQVQEAFAAVLGGVVLEGPPEIDDEELARMHAKVMGGDA